MSDCGFGMRKFCDDLDNSHFSGQMKTEASYMWIED